MTESQEFIVKRKIGSGGFGQVYEGEASGTCEPVAIKVAESASTSKSSSVIHEGTVYKHLRVRQPTNVPTYLVALWQGDPGIPDLKWFGEHDGHVFLVTSLLGPSIQELFERCGRRFSLKTVVMLADEFLVRVQSIHSRGYLHGDVKPDNFVVGRTTKEDPDAVRRIYTLDFGLSQPYWNQDANTHVPFESDEPFVGTRRFASVATHLGYRQSRRDDLESIGYTLLYLLRGRLPWQGLDAGSQHDPILGCKARMSLEELCEGVPVQFRMYLEYCRSLRYEQLPKYDYLRALFTCIAEDYHIEYNFDYDWIASNGEDGTGNAGSGDNTVRDSNAGVAEEGAASTNRGARTPPNDSMSVSPHEDPMDHWGE